MAGGRRENVFVFMKTLKAIYLFFCTDTIPRFSFFAKALLDALGVKGGLVIIHHLSIWKIIQMNFIFLFKEATQTQYNWLI